MTDAAKRGPAVTVRLTPEDVKIIDHLQREMGISAAAVLRAGLRAQAREVERATGKSPPRSEAPTPIEG